MIEPCNCDHDQTSVHVLSCPMRAHARAQETASPLMHTRIEVCRWFAGTDVSRFSISTRGQLLYKSDPRRRCLECAFHMQVPGRSKIMMYENGCTFSPIIPASRLQVETDYKTTRSHVITPDLYRRCVEYDTWTRECQELYEWLRSQGREAEYRRPRPNPLDADDLFSGAVVQVECQDCGGAGFVGQLYPSGHVEETCDTCNGSGYLEQDLMIQPEQKE